ncbi:MAG: hypothetical protein ACK4VM_20140, partial [Bosea sp. (in: a-proteobacteria)]
LGTEAATRAYESAVRNALPAIEKKRVALSEVSTSADAARRRLDQMNEAVRFQAATLGMSSREVEIYRLQMAGATPAQLAFADAVGKATEEFEKQKAALAEGQRITESLRTPIEALAAEEAKLEELRKRGAISYETYTRGIFAARDAFDSIGEAAERSRKQQEEALRAARDALYSGLLTEEEQIKQSYERRKEAILQSTIITDEEKNDLRRRLEEKYAADQQARLDALLQSQYQAYAGLFDGLAGLAKAYAGEQSGAYRALFAVSKAFAIADAMIKVQQAIANAAASGPFPWNLGAMASVAAAVGGVVSSISSISFGGARADGGNVSSDRRYLVGERGPEMFVPNTAGTIVPNDVLMGGRSEPPVVNTRIINAFDPAMLGDFIGSDAGEQVVMNVIQRNANTIRQLSGGR